MKPMLTIAVLFMYFVSCTKENLNEPAASSSQSGNDLNQLDNFYIGQNYGGGMIFYIDSTGQHGLIVSTEEKQVTWWNGEYTSAHAIKTAIGTGYINTFRIITSQGRGTMRLIYVPGIEVADLMTGIYLLLMS